MVYDNLIPYLQSEDYRLLIPDLRGHGNSSKPGSGYNLDNYVEDVLAVARDAHAGRFILVGHSMGGAVVQKLAAERPGRVQALILMSAVPASGFPLPTAYYNLFRASSTDASLQAFIFNISSVDLQPADLQHLLAAAATIDPEAIRESLDAWSYADFADELDAIKVPTKVIVSDDPFLNASIEQQTIVDPIGSNASLTYFPGSGHYMLVEDPAHTAQAINDFISSIPLGRGHGCNRP